MSSRSTGVLVVSLLYWLSVLYEERGGIIHFVFVYASSGDMFHRLLFVVSSASCLTRAIRRRLYW